MMKGLLLAASVFTGLTACTVYQSTGPEPQARPELTPVCYGTKTLRLDDAAVRVYLNRGATLGVCD